MKTPKQITKRIQTLKKKKQRLAQEWKSMGRKNVTQQNVFRCAEILATLRQVDDELTFLLTTSNPKPPTRR